jgi:hypothetical protein
MKLEFSLRCKDVMMLMNEIHDVWKFGKLGCYKTATVSNNHDDYLIPPGSWENL